jgi:hypothetical protein
MGKWEIISASQYPQDFEKMYPPDGFGTIVLNSPIFKNLPHPERLIIRLADSSYLTIGEEIDKNDFTGNLITIKLVIFALFSYILFSTDFSYLAQEFNVAIQHRFYFCRKENNHNKNRESYLLW